ncbi:MAG TPA: preprotein translocase subunit SecG [Candidatus Binataceae bacterium]|nr:preprotein translocase subunit SecG [Candidatus Binataceae bacterium]
MIALVVAFHVIVCVVLCIVILLQQGKGAEVGAVFGGSSQTVFGASGAGNALTKATAGLAVAFFATAMFLAYASARRATGSIFEGPFSSAPASVMHSRQASKSAQHSAPAAPGGHATPGKTK